MNCWVSFEDIQFKEELGRGNYGAVRRGTFHGIEVAVKELFPEDSELIKYFQREVNMLSLARHPNIVEFLGISRTPEGNFLILTEFCDLRGDLHNLLAKENLPWIRRLEISFAIAKAMAFLHGRGIVHRDLKGENILITTDWKVKVCDFGFARKIDRKRHMTMCGTDWTMAPEILLETDYDEKVDVFSYGVILAHILSRIAPDLKHFTRQLPDFGLDPNEIRGRAESGAPEKLIQLAIQCTHVMSEERPTFMEVVETLQEVILEHGSAKAGITSSMLVISDKNREANFMDEMENVFIKRTNTMTEEGKKVYLYEASNKRDYEVKVIVEVSGTNAKITPLGNSTAVSEDKILELSIPEGQDMVIGLVEPIEPENPISFDVSFQVDRADTQVRTEESKGVFMYTTIENGFTRQLTFRVENTKDFDVELELNLEGKFFISCPLPIKKIVPAHQKMYLVSLKTKQPLSTSWHWTQVMKRAEQVSVLKGVNLTKKPLLNPGEFELEVSNTRVKSILVTVTLAGNFTFFGEGKKTNPLVEEVHSGETISLATYQTPDDVSLDWKWKEQ